MNDEPQPTPAAMVRAQIQQAVREAGKDGMRKHLNIRVPADLWSAVLAYSMRRHDQSNLDQADAINELLLLGVMTDNHLLEQNRQEINARGPVILQFPTTPKGDNGA